MAKITVEKNKNFSIVSNDILRDTSLSMKARFLLVFMLSLSDSWEYSLAGLAKVVGCGVDAIRSGIAELEEHKYLVRERVRDEKGRMKEMKYTLYEAPQDHSIAPVVEEGKACSSTEEVPTLKNPTLDSTTQININKTRTNINKNQDAAERAHEDSATADVVRLFSSNIHPVAGAIEQDKLHDLIERYGADWVSSAIKEAAECNGRSIRYIESILSAWEKRGRKGGGVRGGHQRTADATERREQTSTWDDEPDTL